MKRLFFSALLAVLSVPLCLFAESMYSPTWGFFLDLPEGYEYIDGDGRDRFSFCGPYDAMFDLVVYEGRYSTMNDLVNDVNRRIGNSGYVDFFNYYGRRAALIQLVFAGYSGWALCVELDPAAEGGAPPMLLALAYSQADHFAAVFLEFLHISALDSISPSLFERFTPGPVTEYVYPRGEAVPVTLALTGLNAVVCENDALAAQYVIEREFIILQEYAGSMYWQEAWIRYYRYIFRDSYERIRNPSFVLVRNFGGANALSDLEKREFAQRALSYVQDFSYERDLSGSDFLNLVTAVVEGRGDCDTRAMLWAVILYNADIRAAMMVSRQHSHAMGLADIPGTGARFECYGTSWLVAETTAFVDIGLIALDQSDPQHWLGIIFE